MPNYYNPYYQPQQMPQQMVQPQIQNGGFVSVRSEEEARNYPVAQGTSVTFKNETAPYIYTKTTGFSQLDRPMFEKFKLVKEDTEEELKVDKVDKVASEIEALWGEINALKKRNTPNKPKNDGGN
jgi:hypothetical protein